MICIMCVGGPQLYSHNLTWRTDSRELDGQQRIGERFLDPFSRFLLESNFFGRPRGLFSLKGRPCK